LQICRLKDLSKKAVLSLFSNQPGVLHLIPESVAIQVFKVYGEEFPPPHANHVQVNQQEELFPILFPTATKRGWLP